MDKKQPEKKFKAGPVAVTIWENPGMVKDGNPTTFSSISFVRNYKDKEGNWVQTMPGKGFNVLLRLYGPLEAWFDKTWMPGDFELLEQIFRRDVNV